MRAKLSIEMTGVRGTLIFEGGTAEVGKQLRKLLDLLAPVGAEGNEPQASAPPSPAGSVPTEGNEARTEDKGQPQHEDTSTQWRAFFKWGGGSASFI
jgi:hypothetical protein